MSKTVQDLMEAFDWKPIPGCEGRYVERRGLSYQSPEEIAGTHARAPEFAQEAPHDPVLVLKLQGGGLISYRKLDGSFRHTLNDEGGFERKLKKLELDPTQFKAIA